MKLKIKSIEGIFYTIDISLEKASEGCENPYGDRDTPIITARIVSVH